MNSKSGDLLGQLPFASTINKCFNSNLMWISIPISISFQLAFNCSASIKNKMQRNAKDSSGRLLLLLLLLFACIFMILFVFGWFSCFSTWLFKCGTRRCYRHKFLNAAEKSSSNCFRFWLCNFYSPPPGDTIRATDRARNLSSPLSLAPSLHCNWSWLSLALDY